MRVPRSDERGRLPFWRYIFGAGSRAISARPLVWCVPCCRLANCQRTTRCRMSSRRLETEDLVSQGHLAGVLAGESGYFQVHHSAPSLAGASSSPQERLRLVWGAPDSLARSGRLDLRPARRSWSGRRLASARPVHRAPHDPGGLGAGERHQGSVIRPLGFHGLPRFEPILMSSGWSRASQPMWPAIYSCPLGPCPDPGCCGSSRGHGKRTGYHESHDRRRTCGRFMTPWKPLRPTVPVTRPFLAGDEVGSALISTAIVDEVVRGDTPELRLTGLWLRREVALVAKWPRIAFGVFLTLGKSDTELKRGYSRLFSWVRCATTWQFSMRSTVTGTCSPASL